jgi:thiamine biosynthesis protein ThiI
MIFKRGCPVGFVTFHSAPYTPPESVDKVRRLVDMLNRTQVPRPLYVCNIADFQKQVRDLCSESRRTVLYRRAMLRIAWIIAQRERYGALATGESLGQVASQTLSNMAAINSAVDGALVLRPLLGLDKLEIIEMARKMGTFDISKEDVPDSCVVFAPASPATSSIVAKLEAEERKIPDYQGMLERAAAEAAVYWPGHQRNNL